MATKAKTRKHMDELTAVRYLGRNDRVLSVQDLASVGVVNEHDLVWDASNGYTVDISQVNAATADFLFAQDEFELV